MRLHELAQALCCTAVGADVGFEVVVTDTRKPVAGALFVALKGASFDGHAFAAQALAQGAAAVMLERDLQLAPALLVPDTRLALGRLAAWHRSRQGARLAAITGSNGKTTVKEMLAAICQAEAGADAVLATQGNLNNDIGVPLTLLRLQPQHRYAVIEMGMNHAGELAYLTELAHPDVALVNNALRAHLGFFDNVAGIARAKGEIYAGLRPDGVAVINADDAFAEYWLGLNPGRRVLRFGRDARAEVRIVADAAAPASSAAGRYPISLDTPLGRIDTQLRLPGAHNRSNAAAAAAAALALGIPAAAIAQGLAACTGTKGRLQVQRGLFGATLIDDSYNANPDSVLAAVQVLAARPGTRILVLGDMAELGDAAARLHREVGERARAAGIDRLLCLGELGVHAVQGFGAGAMHFERIEELLAELEQALGPEVSVLVKGSRSMRMERVVQSFMPPAGSPVEDESCC